LSATFCRVYTRFDGYPTQTRKTRLLYNMHANCSQRRHICKRTGQKIQRFFSWSLQWHILFRYMTSFYSAFDHQFYFYPSRLSDEFCWHNIRLHLRYLDTIEVIKNAKRKCFAWKPCNENVFPKLLFSLRNISRWFLSNAQWLTAQMKTIYFWTEINSVYLFKMINSHERFSNPNICPCYGMSRLKYTIQTNK